AAGDRRIFGDAGDDPELMDAAIGRAVGIVFEADLPDRAVLLLERRHHISFAEAVGHQAKQRVFRWLRRALAGIGDDEAARAAQGRLGMAQQALVGIVPGTEAIGVGVELREYRIELAEPGDGRTLRYIRASVARRLQLAGANDSFVEGRKLVGRNG